MCIRDSIKPGPVFEIFEQNNLGVTVGDPGSYRVAGLAFDRENNLWISNFGSGQQLRVRKNDDSWKAITVPFSLFENALSQIVIDDNNYNCLLYTSDAADERSSVDLGGRRIIKKKTISIYEHHDTS